MDKLELSQALMGNQTRAKGPKSYLQFPDLVYQAGALLCFTVQSNYWNPR